MDKYKFVYFYVALFLALVLSTPSLAGEDIFKSTQKGKKDSINPAGKIIKSIEMGEKQKKHKPPPLFQPRWIEPNTDRPGSDYRSFWLTGSCEQCQRACAKDPKCKAYTYVKPGIKGRRALCFLKSSVPKPVTNKYCISGVKRAKMAGIAQPQPKEKADLMRPLPQGDIEDRQKEEEKPPFRFPGTVAKPRPQGDIEKPPEYPEGDYVYTEDYSQDYQEGYQGYPEEDYTYPGYQEEYPPYYEEYPEYDEGYPQEKRDILEELGIKIGGDSQEEAMPYEGTPQGMPAEEKPYAGGALSALVGESPELLITDIEMRNPNKKEIIINRELNPKDWVFEVKVVNTGKMPVSNVGVLVAVGDERLETVIEDTIEYNKGAMALVYMRPTKKILSKKSVEVNAVVDPKNEYKENNEENNLFTRTFKLRRD